MNESSRRFPEFAGVALADILANGAAILIMLIVITVMVRHEEEEERLEQVEEVSVLLSRDLATSVVMNALPTSPPSVLHNYVTSPLDRNPTHALMPIIELHTNHVRNYYTGEVFTRNALLYNDNAFDRYLKTLTPEQILRLRVDVYSINLFYIAMSILKDYLPHGPRHWHFLGYTGEGGERGVSGSGLVRRDRPSDPGGRMPGEGLDPGSEQGDMGFQPDSSLDFEQPAWEGYPYDDLAHEPGGGGTRGRGTRGEGDGERDGEGGGQPGLRFRSAQEAGEASEWGMAVSLSLEDLELLLRALFAFMDDAQQRADSGEADVLAAYDFQRDVVPLTESLKKLIPEPQMERFFSTLAALIKEMPARRDATLETGHQTEQDADRLAVRLPLNLPVERVTLVGDFGQQLYADQVAAEVDMTLHLSLYPSVYRGVRVPIHAGSMLLMSPEQPDPEVFRWRVVTAVNPDRTDFVTAFVHAALSKDHQLLISAEENAVSLSGQRMATARVTVPFRSERWLLTLYGIPALLLALGIFRRPKRQA